MFGILLLSHGGMARGMLESCKMFFGEDIEKVEAICFNADDSLDVFDENLKKTVEELDGGHGVVVFCDLMGGTPANRCAMNILSDNVQVIAGMNFTMLLELLGRRMGVENISEIDINEIMEVGRTGIVSLNQFFAD